MTLQVSLCFFLILRDFSLASISRIASSTSGVPTVGIRVLCFSADSSSIDVESILSMVSQDRWNCLLIWFLFRPSSKNTFLILWISIIFIPSPNSTLFWCLLEFLAWLERIVVPLNFCCIFCGKKFSILARVFLDPCRARLSILNRAYFFTLRTESRF